MREWACLFTHKQTEIGAAESSEKSVYKYQNTRRHSPENSSILGPVQWSNVTEIKFLCKQVEGEDSRKMSLMTVGNKLG